MTALLHPVIATAVHRQMVVPSRAVAIEMSMDIFLPNPITLPSGVVAKIELIPMPQPDEQGRYRPRQDCDIQVYLFRGESLIERRPWDSVICGKARIALVDGSELVEEDLYELDSSGWDQMIAVGLCPGALIL